MTYLVPFVLLLARVTQDSEAKYVDRAAGITISIPAGWTVERPPEKEGLLVMYPTQGEDAQAVKFALFAHDTNAELLSGKLFVKDYLEVYCKECQKTLDKFEAAKSEGQRRGDHVVCTLQYGFSQGEAKARTYEYHVYTKKRWYQLVWMAKADAFEKHVATFERISKSFQCEEAASTEEEDPSLDFQAILKEAGAARQADEWDKVIELGKKALRAKADNKAPAYFLIGNGYYWKEQLEEAARYELMAVEADPDNHTFVLDCLEVLMLSGRGAEARDFVARYRDHKAMKEAHEQALLSYLDLTSSLYDGSYRQDAKGCMAKVDRLAADMEKLEEKKIERWDSALAEKFIQKNVKGKKALKLLQCVHDLIHGKCAPKDLRSTAETLWSED